MTKYAANALYAKCHALFGKRLTGTDYSLLLACKSVGDVAAYLKGKTVYADALADIHTPTVRRQQLELHLRSHQFHEFAALCRYEVSLGQGFYRYYVLRGEVAQLLNCLRLLDSEHQDDYLLSIPVYFQRYASLDLFKLAKAADSAEVLEATQGSEYYAILRPFLEKNPTLPDMSAIELALNSFLWKKVHGILKSSGKGKGTQSDGVRYLEVGADMKAIAIAYRMKRYLRSNANQIRAKVNFSVGKLSQKQTDNLLDAPTADELLRRLTATPYGKAFARQDFLYIEDSAARVAYSHALHTFRYSMDAGVTTLAYLDLAENELQNLTHIIEGIRFFAPPDEIRKQLIGNLDVRA
ncbi:MAG: V-type ATPase subunit [Oscillospiraceae bacterium]|jgi:V/A-type H+-transporting ATPase subunit C|nr:V-type ATPase subunit [Oscillospiraceae bacterium]